MTLHILINRSICEDVTGEWALPVWQPVSEIFFMKSIVLPFQVTDYEEATNRLLEKPHPAR